MIVENGKGLPGKMGATSRDVRIENVTCRFGPIVAVDSVSLSIEAGQFLTLLGPSGSGKTSLLQMIAGLLTPHSGRIHIGEVDVTDLAPHRRGIGMVFQNYALFPHLSVYENIAFPLRLRREPLAEVNRLVREALAMIDLPNVGDRRVIELSGGQQQRIALARALVYRPSVLLMDEPLGALDRKLRDQMKFEIKDIQRRLGITVVYVTHDQDEALTMSDLIAVMNHGRVVQLADPQTLYLRPSTRFTAEFVGDSNIFAGQLIDLQDDGARVRTPLGDMLGRASGRLGGKGEAACVMVRPERARLVPLSDANSEGVEATVEHVFFRGEFLEIGARARDGRTIRVKTPPGGGSVVQAGTTVRIGWSRDDAVVVPEEPGRPA